MKGLKNKYLKSILCLGVGAVVLSAAVFANYDNANGYEACKTSLKNMLYLDNFSLNTEISASMDGQKLMAEKSDLKLAGGQDVFYQTSGTSENLMDNSQSSYRTTSQDKVNIYEDNYSDGTTNKYMTPSYRDKNKVSVLDGDDMTAKFVNFAEVVADTMVGDLKNSFVLTSKDDNTRTYTVNLSAEQLPEIVTSGASLIFAGIKNDYDRSASVNASSSMPEDQFFSNFLSGEKDPFIERGTLIVTLNNDDTLSSLNGEIVLGGYDASNNQHNITLQLSGNAYDYGTTVIDRVDTSDAESSPSLKGETPYTYTEDGEAVYYTE